MHLVGFIIRIYHDARSPERQISLFYTCAQETRADSNDILPRKEGTVSNCIQGACSCVLFSHRNSKLRVNFCLLHSTYTHTRMQEVVLIMQPIYMNKRGRNSNSLALNLKCYDRTSKHITFDSCEIKKSVIIASHYN